MARSVAPRAAGPVQDALRAFLHGAIDEHHALVYRVAWRTVQNAADAEDVTQEVFLRLLRQRAAGRPIEALRPWLVRVALNAARNAWRSGERRRKHEGELRARQVEGPARAEPNAEEGMAPEKLRQALEELPEPLRLPLILHYQDGLKYREIADTLGCPQGTVARRIAAAKEQLRRRLGPSAAFGVAPVGWPQVEEWLSDGSLVEVPAGLAERLREMVEGVLATGALAGASGATAPAVRAASGIARRLVSAALLSMLLGTGAYLVLTRASDEGDGAVPARVVASEPPGDPAPESADGALRGPGVGSSHAAAGPESPSPAPSAAESTSTAGTSWSVEGCVTDARGQPIAGALVELLRADVRAEADAGLESSPRSPVGVDANRVRPAAGARAPREEPGASSTGLVESTVTDARGRYAFAARPMPATSVAHRGDERGRDASVVLTAPEGSDPIGGLLVFEDSPELHLVVAGAPGHAIRSSQPFELLPEGTRTVDLSLVSALPLAGVVVADRAPLPGATVRILAHAGSSRLAASGLTAVADASGRFRFDEIPAGGVLVEATAPDHSPTWVCAAAGDEHVTLELAGGATLRVHVTDASTGLPHRDSDVRLARDGIVVAHAISTADGAVLFAHLPPGAYTVRARRGPLSLAEQTVTLSAHHTAEVALTIPVGAGVAVEVQAAPGVPPDDYQVRLLSLSDLPGGESRHVTLTTVDGRHEAWGLPPGVYQVYLMRKGPWGQFDLIAQRPLVLEPDQAQATLHLVDDPAQRRDVVIHARSLAVEPLETLFARVLPCTADAPAMVVHGVPPSITLSLPVGCYDISVASPGHEPVHLRRVQVEPALEAVAREVALAPRTEASADTLQACIPAHAGLTIEQRLTLRQAVAWLATLASCTVRIDPALAHDTLLDAVEVAPSTNTLIEALPSLLRRHRLELIAVPSGFAIRRRER